MIKNNNFKILHNLFNFLIKIVKILVKKFSDQKGILFLIIKLFLQIIKIKLQMNVGKKKTYIINRNLAFVSIQELDKQLRSKGDLYNVLAIKRKSHPLLSDTLFSSVLSPKV